MFSSENDSSSSLSFSPVFFLFLPHLSLATNPGDDVATSERVYGVVFARGG